MPSVRIIQGAILWLRAAAVVLSLAIAFGASPAFAQSTYCVSGLSAVGPDNFLVMRFSPSMQSPWRQDANLRNGDMVEVIGESGPFYRVRFQNQYEGWSAKRYLSPCNGQRRAQPSMQNIPAAFHGVWDLSDGSAAQCRRADIAEGGENFVTISARDVRYYESMCAPKSMRHVSPTAFEATMACSGEGSTWDATDHYSVHSVSGRRHLVIVNLRRTAPRDDTGRIEPGKIEPGQNLDQVMTSLGVECR